MLKPTGRQDCAIPTQLGAVLLGAPCPWEGRAAGNAAFQLTGKPQPGHLQAEKILGHVLEDKTSPLLCQVILGSLPSRPTPIAPLSLSSSGWLEAVLWVSRWLQEDKDAEAFPYNSLSVPSYPLEGYQRAFEFPSK